MPPTGRSERQQQVEPADRRGLRDGAAGLVAQVQADTGDVERRERDRGRCAVDDQCTGTRHAAADGHERLDISDRVGELAQAAGIAGHCEGGGAGHGAETVAAVHGEVAQRPGCDSRTGTLLGGLQGAARYRQRTAARAHLVDRDLHVAIHAERFAAAGDAEVLEAGVQRGGPGPGLHDIAAHVREGGPEGAVHHLAVLDAAVGDHDDAVAVAHLLLVAQVGLEGDRAAAATCFGDRYTGQQLGRVTGIGALDQVEHRFHRADVGAPDADAGQDVAQRGRRIVDGAGSDVGIGRHLGRIAGGDRGEGRYRAWARARVRRRAAAAATAAAGGQQQDRAEGQEQRRFLHGFLFSGLLSLCGSRHG